MALPKLQLVSQLGNENWEFNADGLMERRIASINDLPITENERKFHWSLAVVRMIIRPLAISASTEFRTYQCPGARRLGCR
jgi:nuclear transport factor 2 (NTF2) superfamily protein